MFVDLKNIASIRKQGIQVTEDNEQALVIQWAMRNTGKHPELERLFAVPNGGHRSKRTAAMLKLTGVKRGVPDLFLPAPKGGYHGLWIEMKSLSKHARASKEQRDWLLYLNKAGYKAVVCKGFEEARDELLAYLGVKDA